MEKTTKAKSSRKKTGTKSKSKNSRVTTRKAKKPKVYISSFKIMGMCASVILVCMLLLLVTSVISKNNSEGQKKESSVSIAKRFEPDNGLENIDDVKKSESVDDSIGSEKKGSKKIDSESQKKDVAKNESKTEIVKNKIEENEKKDVPSVKNDVVKPQKTGKVVPPVVEKPKSDGLKNVFNLPKAKNGATLVFVFDDGGQSLSDLDAFLKLPFPITVAVLPKLQYSVESANLVRQSGHELILHQPMQAINRSVNPGAGAIKPEMSEDEVRSLLFSNINEIGPVAGMNNHEGSAITADIEKMAVVLKTASDCGIFFLDSRTNVNTVVPLVAKEMGYNYYERNIFLDNEKTRENALMELKKGLDIANKKGSAVMIGHVWSADFLPALLKELYPELVKNGYKFSVVSES